MDNYISTQAVLQKIAQKSKFGTSLSFFGYLFVTQKLGEGLGEGVWEYLSKSPKK